MPATLRQVVDLRLELGKLLRRARFDVCEHIPLNSTAARRDPIAD
jgi:hypothetical protein